MKALFNLFTALHIRLYRATGGRLGGSLMGARVLLLTTTGNKSGQPRTVPLMTFENGGGWYIIASANGAPAHPAWYKNLAARPEVQVEFAGRRYPARAVTVGDEERARVYDEVKGRMKNFAGYEKKAAPRTIPVVRLDEIAA